MEKLKAAWVFAKLWYGKAPKWAVTVGAGAAGFLLGRVF
jgi:hypothetical protein